MVNINDVLKTVQENMLTEPNLFDRYIINMVMVQVCGNDNITISNVYKDYINTYDTIRSYSRKWDDSYKDITILGNHAIINGYSFRHLKDVLFDTFSKLNKSEWFSSNRSSLGDILGNIVVSFEEQHDCTNSDISIDICDFIRQLDINRR